MTVDPQATVRALHGSPAPDIAPDALVAAGARVVGRVTLGAGSSVWFNAVLRAEAADIRIGARSNLQDSVSCHVDAGFPLAVGTGVSVGHNAVLHGCTIEDGCIVGMSATVMNGAVVGRESLLAGGTVVLEGQVIPPRSLVAGVPGKVRRELTDEEVAGLRTNADHYVENARLHAGAIPTPAVLLGAEGTTATDPGREEGTA
ncbi:gamma carbonic anhydrase family protein [Clavibacter michiganensis subsp. phaseoli]|uniref:gamma carbonic anhydrase family protein n=1 Tax=Clavibacter phaseoli TaxID=1734031 RepID=UPI001FB21CB5|nr:gamma carbonic anhydrase family protein [Clavibacter phaseoli]MCJ1712302.1 gamma carbonic anhydrase family protein [Clavibacter phaseoli]